jgi:hypothetical protein
MTMISSETQAELSFRKSSICFAGSTSIWMLTLELQLQPAAFAGLVQRVFALRDHTFLPELENGLDDRRGQF